MINKKIKVLALTDHSGHSEENSVYALLKGFLSHPDCAFIDIATRGNPDNKIFFESGLLKEINVKGVGPDFIFDPSGKFLIEDCRKVSVDDYDFIFMRLPRPVSDTFLLNLKSSNANLTFINDPAGIVKTSSKAFLLNFPDICPPFSLCRSIEDVRDMAARFQIVLKPLREYGGKGIVKMHGEVVNTGDKNVDAKSYLKSIEKELISDGFLAMKFLKNVDQGDKRLIVVNGQILAASLRLPAKDSWLCNVAQGGMSVPAEPNEEEISIVEKISPSLLENGIFIFGADTLVDDNGKRVLSEINTLSIGGFPQSEKQTGRPIIKQTTDLIFKYVNGNKQSQ